MRNMFVGLRKKIRYLSVCCSYLMNHKYIENYLLKEKKHVFHNGSKYKDKTVYLIDLQNYKTGFFAQYRLILDLLQYADKHNYIPVIRMNGSGYRKEWRKNNLFEQFYIQPCEIAIKDIRNICNIIYADVEHLVSEELFVGGYDCNEERLMREAIIRRKYIKYNEKTEQKLIIDSQNLFEEHNNRILGIHIRGGDYKQHLYNHPIELTYKDYHPYIKEALLKGFDKIFVATDDLNALNEIKRKYGSKVCFYENVCRTTDNMGVHNDNRNNKKDSLGYEVLRDMYTLSLCDGLIAGMSQVSSAAQIERYSRNETFEFVRIINKGIYKFV